MVLSELRDATDACDIYNAGPKAIEVTGSLFEEAKEGGGDKEDGKYVDLVEVRPTVDTLVIEESLAKSFRVFTFRT